MSSHNPDFSVALSYHPILHVPSLDEAEDFYSRVFGRSSINLSTVMTSPPAPGHATDYSIFTMIGDVLIDSLEPKRYVTSAGQRFPDVESGQLTTTGWYIRGVKNTYRALRDAGFRLVNDRDDILEAEEWGGGPSPFYSLPDDAGLRYQFFELFPFPLDPRVQDGWVLPAVSHDDPLGVERASHHTVLTSRPDRAVKLTVDVLGGELIGSGRDDARGLEGPYVRLADSVFHFATPDARSESSDSYYAITWKVSDLDRVAAHLEAEGVSIRTRSTITIVTDPASSLGVPWGFTTESIPGGVR